MRLRRRQVALLSGHDRVARRSLPRRHVLGGVRALLDHRWRDFFVVGRRPTVARDGSKLRRGAKTHETRDRRGWSRWPLWHGEGSPRRHRLGCNMADDGVGPGGLLHANRCVSRLRKACAILDLRGREESLNRDWLRRLGRVDTGCRWRKRRDVPAPPRRMARASGRHRAGPA